MTVTRIQCHPETGPGGSKNRKGLSAGIVPERATSTGCAWVRLLLEQICGTLSHTSSRNGTTFSVPILCFYKFVTSGVSKK